MAFITTASRVKPAARAAWALILVCLLGVVLGGCALMAPGGTVSAPTNPALTNTSPSAPASTALVPENHSGLQGIAESELPPEAWDTLDLIGHGGPFPFDRDGLTFRNSERLLPAEPRGYYREYTVITPGESDRGARRIVVSDGLEKYYTSDHYSTFAFIEEGQ
ncbi:ribonuclease domain-containing protein [Arthrobacter roseus]|uniref:ribonuclease domain-containing protein n=1 Tax=Arthrobacter roseus TaxID=136274 RepID=UPI00196317FC|nr:ribonuclease domain-containing protein [Arthrobacter roseus]MBM7847705.1 ribonuclease T1 [Arthrobacter roseus]